MLHTEMTCLLCTFRKMEIKHLHVVFHFNTVQEIIALTRIVRMVNISRMMTTHYIQLNYIKES